MSCPILPQRPTRARLGTRRRLLRTSTARRARCANLVHAVALLALVRLVLDDGGALDADDVRLQKRRASARGDLDVVVPVELHLVVQDAESLEHVLEAEQSLRRQARDHPEPGTLVLAFRDLEF